MSQAAAPRPNIEDTSIRADRSAIPEAPELPALVVGRVSHTRRVPRHHSFTYGHYQWLVDVDELPRYGWPLSVLARFDARDHLDSGRLGGGIRGDVERFLARYGVDLPNGARIVMLANARVLGHVFDPLTVFWCIAEDGSPLAVVFEVHNTYGERHAYLMHVDDSGRATADKAFYVSPFNDVSGTYTVRLRLSPDRVAVSIGLDRDGRRVLTATTSGRPVPATRSNLLRTSLRHPLMTQQVTALIRLHGVLLWLGRLPVQPRPKHSLEAVR
ncbi:MAG: DUF1365 domain-containing protein [Candidatus Nanopelagicales bacterium]